MYQFICVKKIETYFDLLYLIPCMRMYSAFVNFFIRITLYSPCKFLNCLNFFIFFIFSLTSGKTYKVQRFVKIKTWLRLIFSTFLHDQLKINYRVLEDSSSREKNDSYFTQQVLR